MNLASASAVPPSPAAVQGPPDYRRPLRRHWLLAVIVALYVVLGLAFNLATPIGEAVDEATHLDYALYLRQERRLPVLSPIKDVGVHQAGHPPLYYLLAAVLTAGMDVGRPDLVPNPHFSFNWDRPEPPPPNVYVHVQDPPLPYLGAPALRAARVMRLVSLASGVVTVIATYALALAVAPALPVLAPAAAGVVGFLPTFAFFGGALNNDALANALATLALLGAVRVAQARGGNRGLWLLGVALGLGMMTKMTVAALVPVAGLAILAHARRTRTPSFIPGASVRVGLPVVALTGWWFARNVSLYGPGDPLGWRIWSSRTPDLLRKVPIASELPTYLRFQLVSFFGAFGWANIRLPDVTYTAFAALLALAALGLVVLVARRRRTIPPDTRWGLAIVGVALAIGYLFVFQLLRTFNLSVSQGRYLFFVLPAFAVLFVAGLAHIVPARARAAVLAVVVLFFLGLSSWSAFILVPAAYAEPMPVPEAEVAAIPHRVDLDIGDRFRLIGYGLVPERVTPGETLTVTLYWTALPANWEPFPKTLDSFVVFVHAVDATGEVVARRDAEPFAGRHPMIAWRPGDVLRESYRLDIAPDAVPGRAAVLAGVFDEANPARRLWISHAGQPAGDTAHLEPLVIRSPASVRVPSGAGGRGDRFGDPGTLRLVGAVIPGATVQAGRAITMTLYWQADEAVATDLTVFVHLAGSDGLPVAFGDGPPRRGAYPTSLWEPGEIVEDARDLGVPPDVPPGRYRLEIGVYDGATDARLHAVDTAGRRWADDAVDLGIVTVVQ